MTWRGWMLLAVVVLVAVAVGTYARLAPSPGAGPERDGAEVAIPKLETPPPPPFILMRSLIPDDTYNRIGLAALDRADGPRFIAPLACERVHFAGGHGVCLTIGVSGLLTAYGATVFDAAFQPRGTMPLTGVPSRVRVSPDGRRAAITVFEQGHSYAESGFSTRTSLVDVLTATELGDLESFHVTRDGHPFKAVDFNFWGVTFARDGNRFFATLATGGVKYLVEGDVDPRSARVIGTGVECPSLSPDNTRIAYKQAFTGPQGLGWHLRVLDLATMNSRELPAETRSVDDQVEWLDDGHVMYHLPGTGGTGIWALPVDGGGPPRLVIPQAYSPAVVRREELRN